MLKDGDLQNSSKVGLNMCFTADLYHWNAIINISHWNLLARQKLQKKDLKAKKRSKVGLKMCF